MINIEQFSLTTKSGVKLLSEISLTIPKNNFVVIIGPNGAGKSSLLSSIAGDFKHHKTSGTVNINGVNVREWSVESLATTLSFLPQLSLLNFPYRVEEVVTLGRIPHNTGYKTDQLIVTEAMQNMDIYHLRDCLYPQLSGGEKQRVHHARVLSQVWAEADKSLSDDKILLLDEPTSALDIRHKYAFMEQIKQFSQLGVQVVAVMHDFALAAQFADRLVAMKNARIVAEGKTQDVFTKSMLTEIFDVDESVLTKFNDLALG